MAAYYKALADGQFPVRWAGDLNYGYGMPLFNFIYQLPYWISSFFIFLGLGLVNSFKITLSISFIFSGIFMFLFAKELVNDDKKAFLITILYQFAPFRLIELLVRGSFGEVYTYTFLPLVLFGILKFLNSKNYLYLILTSVTFSLLIFSHNSVSLMFSAVIVLFSVFFAKNIKNFILISFSLLLGLLISAYYWLPALLEHKFTHGDLYMKNIYKDHFVDFYKFIVPNLTNDPSLRVEGIIVHIGIVHTIVIILALWILIFKKDSNKKMKSFAIYPLILIFLSFLFMQKISSPIWENISLVRQFQFPWRSLSVVVFSTSFLAVYVLNHFKLKKVLYWFVVFFIIFATSPLWNANLGYQKINEKYYWNFPLNTTYYGETDVIWSAGPAKAYPKKRAEIISGKADISNFVKKSNMHTFSIKSETDIVLVDHTQYFPGWRAYVDGRSAAIQFQDPNHRGEVEFSVPKGEHDVKVLFTEARGRIIADFLSIFGVIIALLLIILFFLSKKNTKKSKK